MQTKLIKAMTWLILGLTAFYQAHATPVDETKAGALAAGWLKAARLSTKTPGQAVPHFAADGTLNFYVVPLKPTGFVIVAANDETEPVIAFSANHAFDSKHPQVADALSFDMNMRIKALQNGTQSGKDAPNRAIHQAKWNGLVDQASSPMAAPSAYTGITTTNNTALDDLCVAPLLQTEWSQSKEETSSYTFVSFYNYYTPPYAAGNVNNYYTGCVATAWAQIMRFWQWPQTGVGTGSFTIQVNGINRQEQLRGGDGAGGAYNWSQMPLKPYLSNITLAQQQAIGALMHDAGVSMGMSYAADGSAAWLDSTIIQSVFKYANSCNYINWWNDTSAENEPTARAIRTNLDAGLPTAIAIYGATDGHEVVCDGYGYSQGTIYTHVNFGWDGDNDLWYALPVFNAPNSDYTQIYSTNYNIDPQIKGEIISGRVCYDTGAPASGAVVSLTGNLSLSATTNSAGIYAFKGINSGATFTATAKIPGSSTSFVNNPRTVTTGSSYTNPNDQAHCQVGNRIADFTSVSGTAVIQISAQGSTLSNGGNVKFGTVSTSGTQITFTVKNTGQGKLTGFGFSLSGTTDFTTTSIPGQTQLQPGQSTTFTTTFRPKTSGGKSATLHVTSNDPLTPDFQIGLSGTGSIPPSITNDSAPCGTIGFPFALQINAKNADTYGATGLPPGITVDPITGAISGIPIQTGSFSMIVSATNPYGTGTAALLILINDQQPFIKGYLSRSAPVNIALTYDLGSLVSGSVSSFTATDMPPGMTINAVTGLISGTPTMVGNYIAKITLSNAYVSQIYPVTFVISLPLDQLTGSYRGLVCAPGKTPGNTTLALTSSGVVSGSIAIAGRSFKVAATLNINGDYTGILTDPILGVLNFYLSIDQNPSGEFQLNGHLQNSNLTATFTASPDAAPAQITAGLTGNYTALLIPGTNSAGVPQGTGYGRATVSTAGVVSLSLTLANHTSVTCSGNLAKDLTCCVLYTKTGQLFGTFKFQNTPSVSDADGTLTWNGPGFSTPVTLLLSKYTPPATVESGTLNLTYNDSAALSGTIPYLMTSTSAGVGVNPKALSLKIVPATGLFSGKFLDSTNMKRNFYGVLFQKQNSGAGIFAESKVYGNVEIGH